MVVLGIDGGGSNTRAVLAAADGDVLGVGFSGASNYDDVGVDIAQANVDAAVKDAWTSAGRTGVASAVFLGMAGVRSERDVRTIEGIARALALVDDGYVGVDHDIRTALAGGLAGESGIALIAGTGSSCYGRTADGRSWVCGGWGSLDDLGSSWHLGMQAIKACLEAYDGRGRSTCLESKVQSALKLDNLLDINHRYHVEGISRFAIAALAPIVVEAAESGDAIGRDILDRGALELSNMVDATARKLEFGTEVSVVTVGGLINGAPAYRERVVSALRAKLPGSRIVSPILPPVIGAALLALDGLDIAPSRDIIQNLRSGAAKFGLL